MPKHYAFCSRDNKIKCILQMFAEGFLPSVLKIAFFLRLIFYKVALLALLVQKEEEKNLKGKEKWKCKL